MAKRRTFAAALISLVCAFVLVFSLGLMTACGNDETASGGSETAETVGGAWYYGAALPSNALGVSGDYYLNTTTLLSYVKDGQVWRLAANGEAGTWYHGTTAPDGNEGTEGDFYLNVQTGDLYQKKSDGWGQPILTLKGEKGRDGVIWFSGKGEPKVSPEAYPASLEDAIPGDFYIDTTTWKVYQLVKDSATGTSNWIPLGSIRGEDAKPSLQFFNGNGAPSEEITAKANEGDLYLGQFTGLEEGVDGSGSRLYRYTNHDWVPLMESFTKTQVTIHTYQDLVQFRTSVENGTSYGEQEVHLKADIDLSDIEGASYSMRRAAARSVEWAPIGSSAHPFTGIFDGEGHTISNLNVEGTTAGLFGATEDATIKNLTITGANVEAAANGKAGILVAEAKGTLELKNIEIEDSTVKKAEEADSTVGALVGSAAEAESVTVGGVTVELTEDSTPELAEENTVVGSGSVEYSKEEGASGFKSEVEEGFSKIVDLANNNKDAYEITSLEGFKTFRGKVNGGDNFAGKTVYLAVEIDLKDEASWDPIGKKDGTLFEGTFDGKGHTISNLTITGGADYAGLFNSQGNALFKNLTLQTVNIAGGAYVGSLVGYGWTSKYEGVKVYDAVLTGNHWMGGISGGSYSSFTDCHVDGLTITCTPNQVDGGSYDNGDKVGGLTGICESGSFYFRNCSVKNATLTGYRDIGAFVGCSHTGHVENSELKNVKIVVDWETNFYGQKDVNAGNYYGYIGRDDNSASTVDAASQKYESEVTLEYRGITVKVGNKVFSDVQDAFYAVYDMGPDADNDGDIVIELLEDVDLKTTDLKELKAPSRTYTWIDAFGVYNSYTSTHTGSDGKDKSAEWPSYTFNGGGHTITCDVPTDSSSFLIYTGGNYNWTVTFENLIIKGFSEDESKTQSGGLDAKDLIYVDTQENRSTKGIVFKDVNITCAANNILDMTKTATVTLDHCNFTNTKNSDNSFVAGNSYKAVRMGTGTGTLNLINGSYVSAITTAFSSPTAYSKVYVDRTSSLNFTWLKAAYEKQSIIVEGAFIFEDGTAPADSGLTESVTITYANAQAHPEMVGKPLQPEETETQWFYVATSAESVRKALA